MRVRTPIDVGLMIRERRRALAMDQKTLAAHIGVNRQWVIDLEKGRPGAGLGLVLRAANVLGLRLSMDAGEAPLPLKTPTARPALQVDIDAIVNKARGRKS